MTDEEMAEEYCNKLYAGKVKNEDYDEYGRLLYRCKEIKDAFLAGLEVGEEKVKEEEAELQQKWLEESFEKSKLVKENVVLKEKLKPENCLKLLAKDGYVKFTSDQLTEAKEIIKKFLLWENDWHKKTESKYELLTQAEQFLEATE